VSTISGMSMPIPLSCWISLVWRSAGAEATAVGWSDIDVLAVSTSRAVLAARLFSRLVLPELLLLLLSAWVSVLSVDPCSRSNEGRLLAARLWTLLCALLCTRLAARLAALLCARLAILLAARLCASVPLGENVPDRAKELRLLAAAKALAREKAFKLAWCSGSTLPRYLDLGISWGL
jgi:hypothetical protein